MGSKTPLYESHLREGARIVDFGGWDMPLHYGSQVEEHNAVRRDAGVFDVSHMAVVDLGGERCRELLRYLLANDVDRLKVPGKALYSCLLLPNGGVIDDLIAYFLSEGAYRLVVNAGTRDKDLAWIRKHATEYDVSVLERRELAMIAIQGPQARAKTTAILPPAQAAVALKLAPFCGAPLGSWFIARTGYTGEDGFELMLPAEEVAQVWDALLGQGVRPVGLGARDTLRLEAGMNLYGNDLDENHHPLESGLAWTVAFEPADRDFIGRKALESLRGRAHPQLVGLLLEERGVLRAHQKIVSASDSGEVGREDITSDEMTSDEMTSDEMTSGEVTSGTFSPTLNRSIALARISRTSASRVMVDIRGKLHEASIVKPPFVRHGKALVPISPKESSA